MAHILNYYSYAYYLKHNPYVDPYDEDFIIEYYLYIFNDKKHNSKFVQHCFKLHWDHMLVFGYVPNWHLVWSDGCGSRFKSSKPWFFVNKYPNINNGCKMIWSFFGSSHGKGPHDGARTIIKRFSRGEQLNVHGEKLQNAEEVVTFLRKHLFDRPKTSYVSVRKPIKGLFWHIKLDHVIQKNSSCNCDLVKGCMKLHSIFAYNKHNLTQFWFKDFASYYILCLDHKWGDCENLQWSGNWTSKHLQPSNTRAI